MPEGALTLLCGLAAGLLAGKTVGTGGMGIWIDMLIGVAGAFLAKFAFAALGIDPQGNFLILMGMAIIGAAVLTIAIRMLRGLF